MPLTRFSGSQATTTAATEELQVAAGEPDGAITAADAGVAESRPAASAETTARCGASSRKG
jgi:hypothetical protein